MSKKHMKCPFAIYAQADNLQMVIVAVKLDCIDCAENLEVEDYPL